MSDDSYTELHKMYARLRGEYSLGGGKLINESLFLSFMNKRSTGLYKLLIMTATRVSEISPDSLGILMAEELVRPIDDETKIAITMKGIWRVEEEIKKISLQKFLKFVELSVIGQAVKSEDKKLKPNQRLALFTTISMRAFAESSCVDLKSERVTECWKKIILRCSSFLQSIGVLPQISEENLFGKSKNVNPVYYFFRQCEELQKMTYGAWKPGNQKYYLDLFRNDEFDWNLLRKVMTRCFDAITLTHEIKSQINDFIKKVSSEYETKVFGTNHKFSTTDYSINLENLVLYQL